VDAKVDRLEGLCEAGCEKLFLIADGITIVFMNYAFIFHNNNLV
jgi:hypothetical protein